MKALLNRAAGLFGLGGAADEFAAAFADSGLIWTAEEFDEAARTMGLSLPRARTIAANVLVARGEAAAEAEVLAGVRESAVELRNRFGLPDAVLLREFAELGERALAEEYERLFEIDMVDTRALGELADRLRIPNERAIAIVEKHALAHVETYLGEILADGRIEPREDIGLEDLRRRTGAASLEFDSGSMRTIENARRRWSLETEPLVEVPCPLILQRGERCFLSIDAEATEMRQRTVRINYAGPTASIRIMKGVRYRVGSIQAQRIREEYEHGFGTGTLVLTDRRLLWAGPNKSLNYRYNSIIDLETFSDAIEVRRSMGKPMRFYFAEDIAPAIVAERLIRYEGAALA